MTENSTTLASILVVDDEQIVLSLVEDTLTDEGYQITTTPSARKAIELAQANHFDFVLTDIRMPEMNGIEMVKEIHKHNASIGVIFMTGYANLDTAKQAIKEGAYDYIMKPFEINEIRQAVARAVLQKQETANAALSQELNKITGLSNRMYATGDLNSLLNLSLAFAIIQSKADYGLAVYFDKRHEELVVLPSVSHDEKVAEPKRLSLSTGDWAQARISETTAVMDDEKSHPLCHLDCFDDYLSHLLPVDYYPSHKPVIVPLVRTERLLGFITLFQEDSEYELKSSDIQLLNFISSQLTISLENLQLLEDSQEAYRRLENLQDQTLQLEKMATRGQMSAEIGHELNNYLGVVIANFQLMELRLKKGITDGLERFTESIHDHLEKITRFTKGLMDYSSLQTMTLKRTDINQLLGRIVEFLSPQKRFRDFDIITDFSVEMLEIDIDQGLIEQVLYNFLNNAADASLESPVKKIEISSLKLSDEMVQIKIRDHGAGIEADKLDRLFKEKFTTKETGHGIGLVVCKNIIDKHNGKITVDSVLSQGTAFSIDLPMRNNKAAEEPVPETV